MARSLIVLSNDTSALQLFSEYFSDDMYIDTLVSDAIVDGFFRDNAIEMELSAVERRVLAVGFSQMVLLPHAAFVCMREALSQCRNGGSDHDSGLVAWDRAAAFLLGSGHLSPYDLGQTHCAKFGTCALETGVAESNRMMVDLLYAGRGALTQHNASHSLQCEVLVKLSKEIQALVWVPIFQAALQSTLQVSRSANAEVAALAFVSSRAVLPLIHDLDPKAALKLKKLLPLKTAKFDASTGVLVMDSFSRFYDDLNIDCDWIGQIGEYHPCQSNNSDQFENAAQDLSTGAVASIILVTLLAAVAAFCYWRRNRHRRRSQSDNSLSGHVAATSSKDQDDDHLSSNTSSVDKALGSDSTMDTFDPNLINKSFRSSGSQLSSKANRTLTRITSYGDDSEKVLEEDSILRKRQSRKETGSSTVISKEDHEMDII